MQDRWVSYIYRYRADKRCENAGYIKIIRTSRGTEEEARVQIGLKLYKSVLCRCRVYLIYDSNRIILMDEFLVKPEEKDVISIKKSFPWNDFGRSGASPKDYDGMLMVVDDGETLMSLWKDREIDISTLKPEETQAGSKPEPVIQITSVEAVNKVDNNQIIENQEKEKPQTDDLQIDNPIAYMFKTYIKLPQFIDSPFLECVKIVPQDIGRLPISNWKLGSNSFLTHGYYKYRYIMLGKINFDKEEKYIIGVPGVYTNKEKYLANMFGFNLFVPVKKADVKTGNFGYWVWEILRQ